MESSPVALPRLLTAPQVAASLGLAVPRVYELAREGNLPVVRLGRSMRFHPAQVAAFIEAGGTANRDAA